jgi:PAS domain S-box-containing protein
MDDVSKPVDDSSPSVKTARAIAFMSRVDINTRLALCFVLTTVLMLVGTGILLWQSRVMRAEANRLREMDEQFMEVQRVHAFVLSFRNESEQLVNARNPARVQQEAPALRNQLNDSLRQTQRVFRGIEANNILDPTVLPMLETIQGSLPSQIDSLTTLATMEDWEAVNQRTELSVEALEILSAELVDTAGRDIQAKRLEANWQIERSQNRMVFISASVSALTIMVAALLGFAVTQSITRPLRSLVNGASNLARGEFGHRIPVHGRDELAHLSQVFNQTTIRLQDLYENLRRSEQELRNVINYLAEAQRLGHIGNWTFYPAKGFEYWSDELFRIHGLDPRKGPPNSEQYLAAVHPQDREFMASLMKRLLLDDSGFDVTKRIVWANGEIRYVRCVGTTVADNDPSRRIGVGIDVTDHEGLTQELRRREAYLAEAQSLSHTGSFGWKPGSGEIAFSEETYRIYDYNPAEKVTLDKIIEQVHPDDRALVLETAERASSTGGTIDFTHRLLFADGHVKYLHILAKPLRSTCDEIEFAGAVIDITESKQSEERIRRSESELRTLIEAIPAYVGTNLPDGSLDFINQSWLNYAGVSREQVMGWGWGISIHPDDRDRVVANWRAAVATGAPAEYELRCRRADGTYHWFLYRGLPLRDDGGNVVKWFGTLTNIDALKEIESALQMREQELLGIIETVPSMLWSTSPTGEVTHINQQVLEYSGLSLQEFQNLGWKQFIHPDDFEGTAKAFFHAIQTGEPYSATHRLRRIDGEYRWHHASGRPLRDSHGTVIQWYGLSIDIDERKRAEDHLRDARIKLTRASRIATVAELSASIAHELNQPLMAIFANAHAAKRWLTAAPPNVTEVNASIECVLRDARAADETMQHIRALFKQESFDKREANIADIMREAVRFVREDPKKREVPIDFRFDDPLPAVSVDMVQIQQLFINLVSNAIEALEGSPVPPLVTLLASTTDLNELIIQVIDNGPGIVDTERIFDAFVTTKDKGMGIGLAVSRSIVEAHGGRLWAENNIDGGSRFSVALPLSSVNRDPIEA